MTAELKQRFGVAGDSDAGGGKGTITSTAKDSPAPNPGETLPLLFNLEAEAWLLERLKDHGIDVYADGPVFTHFRDRLRKVITDNRIGPVIVGRREGRPESYQQAFERLYGEPLKAKASKAKAATKASP